MLEAFLRQTKIPLRVRKKLGKLIPIRAGRDFAVNLFENTYRGTTGNHLDDKTWLYGMHEPASIRLMRGILRAQRAHGIAPVYMDVGTNTGAHLLAIATQADRAFGFEPWEPVRARALQNLAANTLSHVTIFDFGLGETDATLPFAPPVAGNHGTGSFFRRDEKSTTTLQVRRGDNVVQKLGITPTLIKIDTEGFDTSVLAGLADTLKNARPAVVFEYSAMTKAQLEGGGALTRLFGEGYVFYGLKPSREYPKIEALRAGSRYENVLAWPVGAIPVEDAVRG